VETKPTRDEMLRDVMVLAHEKHYRGEGNLWGWMEREKALESGAYASVLRSEEFCQKYWLPQLIVGTSLGPNPPKHLIVNSFTDEQMNEWKKHFAALKTAEDPLTYCYENMP
jgi:hypothetical protein